MRNVRYQIVGNIVNTPGANLQPIRTSHLKDEAYTRLKAAIVSVHLPPGAALIEARLAEQLGISKTPIRHALIRLEKEGFVSTVPFKGTFVLYVTSDDMRELFEVREAYERAGARLAVQRASDDELSELRGILDETRRAAHSGELEASFPLIQAFHRRFMEIARSPRLLAAYGDVDSQMERIRIIAGHIPGRVDVSVDEHSRVLAAIEARDAGAAERAVHDHLTSLLAAYLDAMASQNIAQRDIL